MRGEEQVVVPEANGKSLNAAVARLGSFYPLSP